MAQLAAQEGVSGQEQTLQWDANNRLAQVVSSSGVTETYRYDEHGQRIRQQVAYSSTVGDTVTYVPFVFYEQAVSAGGSVVTRHYSVNGERVAVRVGGALSYVYRDQVGSTILASDASTNVVSSRGYYAFGATRRSSGVTPTDRRFTGQVEDPTGLYYYNSRYYDPQLGQFISPDTIVPEPNNLLSYNRYLYGHGNPVKFSDPSGHQACSTDFCWKDRWYRAHGYYWDPSTSHWSTSGQAQFDDPAILSDTVGEAGIEFVSGMFGLYSWTQHEMELMGQGIVALANKVGGFSHLQSLLGGGRTTFERERVSTDVAGAFVCFGRLPCPSVYDNWITVFDGTFAGSDDYARGTAVHELAHVIDFNSPNGHGWLSANVPSAGQYGIGTYGSNHGQMEFFAEAVAMWVFDTPRGNPNSYRTTLGLVLGPMPTNLRNYLDVQLVAP